jgi:hypothetical protein
VEGVLEKFKADHVPYMKKYSESLIVLLIDFFDHVDIRREEAKAAIPPGLTERVFILGVRSKPEKLPGPSFEQLGTKLAEDCRDGTAKTWSHELLRHNAPELDRLRERARAILFN